MIFLLLACAQPDPCAVSGSPDGFAALLEHLEALPETIDAACLIRSFAPPLQLEATSNPVSAQPAEGAANPRVFLFSGDLTLSLVPTGYGSTVVEFGEHTGDARSRKAELALPIEQPVVAADLFSRIEVDATQSTCGDCHPGEQPHPDGGWTSTALRPESFLLVDLDHLRAEANTCGADTQRCVVLRAWFDQTVEHRPFPVDYPTLDEVL